MASNSFDRHLVGVIPGHVPIQCRAVSSSTGGVRREPGHKLTKPRLISTLAGSRAIFTAVLTAVTLASSGFESHAQLLGEPVAPSFYPATILNWDPTNDPDAFYNKSTVPLATRFVNPALDVNPHARTNEAGVMSLVAFNSTPVSSAEGSHTNRFYAGNYWQYMKSMVYWGGSAGSGIVLVPNGHVIDAAHRNGVMMMGNVFFPPTVYGGKFQWVTDFLQPSGTSFPVADKLIEAAQ